MTNNKSAVSFHSQPKGRASHSTLLIEMIKRNEIKDAKTIAAILYYKNFVMGSD